MTAATSRICRGYQTRIEDDDGLFDGSRGILSDQTQSESTTESASSMNQDLQENDWGLYAWRMKKLDSRILQLQFFFAAVAGITANFQSDYMLIFTTFLLGSICASVGYMFALEQIKLFAHNRYARQEYNGFDYLPVSFDEKFRYSKSGIVGSFRLFFTIAFTFVVPFAFLSLTTFVFFIFGKFLRSLF